jgi:hypothetical protein
MSLEFYKTIAGRKFYDGTMPNIATQLERIANSLESIAVNLESTPAEATSKQDFGNSYYQQRNLVDDALNDIAELAKQGAEDSAARMRERHLNDDE